MPSPADLPPSGEPSDADLIRRAQAGEEPAFELLVRRHGARVLRVVRNLVSDPDEAADLVQEAWMRVFRSLDRFDFEHEFPTWVFRIATNLAIDWLRRRRPLTGSEGLDEDQAPIEPTDLRAEAPSSDLERADTARRVRACIAALAPHFQSALVLREIEGLSCARIAAIVGATEVTVRWRLHRGRKLFQDEWERRERAGRHRLPDAAGPGAPGANLSSGPAVGPGPGAGHRAGEP